MTKTFDNIRKGTVMNLAFLDVDGMISYAIPVELEWAKKWVVVQAYFDNQLRIRGTKLKRDLIVNRSGDYFVSADLSLLKQFVFVPSKDVVLLIPMEEKFDRKKTSVDIYNSNALRFISKHDGINPTTLINEAVRDRTQNITTSIANKVSAIYAAKTGSIPSYLTVFNSVVSPDYGFLRELKLRYGGRVELDQMRWIAFEGDDLVYNPNYADN